MRKGYGLVLLAIAALMATLGAGGCRLVIGFEDAVLDAGGAGGHGGAGGEGASCSDGTKNGNETGKDCGGSCAPCPVGGGCMVGPDCGSKVCTSGSCVAPACDDKVKNGDEADIDCGGSCSACGPGKSCGGSTDCKSGQCIEGACVSTCTDAAKGGAETDVDCGGGVASICAACANGKSCKVGTDCVSAVCGGSVCLDNYVWARDLGGQGAATSVSGVALDAMGNATIVGILNGSTNFGGGMLTSVGGDNVFVARYDSGGNPLSAIVSGSAGKQSATAVAVDVGGNSVVAGDFEGQLQLGCSLVTAVGGSDVFVAKSSPFGVCSWTAKFGDGLDQHAKAVATDAMGNIVVAGDFEGSINFGSAANKLTSLGGDIFLAKLDPSGTHLWSRRFGDAEEQRVTALATNGAGTVAIAGMFLGSLKLGPTALLDVGSGAFDIFLAEFDGAGNHLWSTSFAVSAPFADVNGLAIDSTGSVYATGDFVEAIDFGGTNFASDGVQMFIAKLDGTGKHVWSKAFGAGQDARGTSIALDPAGNLIVTGVFTGTVDFGGGPVVSAGMSEGVVLKLDANGNYLWDKHYGSGVDQLRQRGVAYDSSSVLLVGAFGGSSLDFGGGAFVSVGSEDTFLARLRTP